MSQLRPGKYVSQPGFSVQSSPCRHSCSRPYHLPEHRGPALSQVPGELRHIAIHTAPAWGQPAATSAAAAPYSQKALYRTWVPFVANTRIANGNVTRSFNILDWFTPQRLRNHILVNTFQCSEEDLFNLYWLFRGSPLPSLWGNETATTYNSFHNMKGSM